MGTFSDVLDFLTDHQKKPSLKLFIVVISLLVLSLLNNILGFTYHYAIDKKIESIQKLNSIIKDSVTDYDTKKYAWRTRKELVDRKDWIESAYEYVHSNFSSSEINNEKHFIPRNNFLFNITSGGFFYLFSICFFILVLVTNSNATIYSRISTGLFSGIVIWCIGFFFYSVFGLIPLLNKTTWGWNYGLNLALQSLVVSMISGFIVYAVKKRKKQSNKEFEEILEKYKT